MTHIMNNAKRTQRMANNDKHMNMKTMKIEQSCQQIANNNDKHDKRDKQRQAMINTKKPRGKRRQRQT